MSRSWIAVASAEHVLVVPKQGCVRRWGYALRYGLAAVSEADMDLIAVAMQAGGLSSPCRARAAA
jgi:hypothetical protein